MTIDAMGCQRDIAQTIIDKKADYILALKGNQGTLKDDVKLFVDEQKAVDFKDAKVSRDKTVDGDHGRIETRQVTVVHDVEWLRERHDWPGLKSVVVVESTREVAGKIDREMRLYITSLVLLANQIGPMVRGHWMIENGLHWVLDMIFRDDECRVRTDNAPANFAIIKHIAYNLMRRAATKNSMRLRRKVAAWDDEFLASLIAPMIPSPNSPGARIVLRRGSQDRCAWISVEVDVVCLQTLETGLHSVHDVAARCPYVISARADAAIDLRPDHDVMPRDAEVFKRLSEESFRSRPPCSCRPYQRS